MIRLDDPTLEPIRPLLERILKRPVDASMVWRWTRGKNARKIRLEAIRVSSRLYTTPAAVQEWAAKCSADLVGESPAPPPPHPQIKRGVTVEELKAAGIM